MGTDVDVVCVQGLMSSLGDWGERSGRNKCLNHVQVRMSGSGSQWIRSFEGNWKTTRVERDRSPVVRQKARECSEPVWRR